MPALEMRAAGASARRLRRISLGLAVLFLATLGPGMTAPVEGRDWTPQIKVARGAQVYWESLMRDADADLRGLHKAQRQARKHHARVERRLAKETERRAKAKRALDESRTELAEARARQAAAADAAAATAAVAAAAVTAEASRTVLVLPDDPRLVDLALAAVVPRPAPAVPPLDTGASPRAAVPPAEAGLARLERAVKGEKRSFRKAQRTTRRAARNLRAARSRIASLRAAERGAVARREVAERNLGAWILAMGKYGRIRAGKKSKTRPGVSTPFAWPARGRISQSYHGGHDGLDIVSYSGAPIRAAAFGVVTYVGWNPWDKEGRAFVVVVTHAGRYDTVYGHLLPQRTVRVGQEVRKGEVIGAMGNTGKSTGTHLHFELRRGSSTLNPLGFL